jgi:carbon storage regulator CsrA
MLVLSRRLGQKVLFPGLNVSIRIVSCKGNSVRIGIDAPPEVLVLRGELSGRASLPENGERELNDSTCCV